MEVSQLWFRFVRFYVQLGLYFYAKKIRVVGIKNVPKKGAVLFAVNHPNGLLDPLIVTTNNPRGSYFLVKANKAIPPRPSKKPKINNNPNPPFCIPVSIAIVLASLLSKPKLLAV